MSQELLKAKVAKHALALCINRIESNRASGTPVVMDSIRAQLEWLVSFFDGRNDDRTKLHELMFGYYAVRELDPSDEEFVAALNRAFYVATQTGKGLRIDLGVLGLDSEQST